MPRQPREPRWNLEKIKFRPPEIPLRGGYPVLRQSRPVWRQVEPRQTYRSSSREELPPRKRHRHEYRDHSGRVDPREVPQVFSPRDMREIRGMLRSRGRTPHRPNAPRSSEADPDVGGHHRTSNLQPLPTKRDRARLAVGKRGTVEYGSRREDRRWSGAEKKMKHRK